MGGSQSKTGMTQRDIDWERRLEQQRSQSSPPSITQTVMKYIFFASILVTFTFVTLKLFHYTSFGTFTLNPNEASFMSVIGLGPTQQSAYPASAIGPYASTQFTGIKQKGYTVSFDVYLGSSLNNGAHRVVFYNGNKTGPDTQGRYLTSQGDSAVTPTSISTIQAAITANLGNICVYIDPVVNDMYVSYYCGAAPTVSSGSSGSGSGSSSSNNLAYLGWQRSKPIKNVPLGKPFRVTLAVDPNFIETYINGELLLTTKTPGVTELYVYPGAPPTDFFGSPEFSSACRTGQFNYWDAILPPKSIKLYSSTPAPTTAYAL